MTRNARESQRPKGRHASQLLLTIDQTLYAVRPLPAASASAERAFLLQKLDGTSYSVENTLGGAHCDCPDFIFRRDGIDPQGCKHIRALVAQGLVEAVIAQPTG